MSAMEKEYGANAEKVFYASRNSGKIKDVDPKSMGGFKKKKQPKWQ